MRYRKFVDDVTVSEAASWIAADQAVHRYFYCDGVTINSTSEAQRRKSE